MIAAGIPRIAASVNLPVLGFSPQEGGELLLANFNSYIFDYMARQNVGGTHLAFYILKQLPVVPRDAYNQPCPWNRREMISTWLGTRTLELSYVAWNLKGFAEQVGYAGAPFRWHPQRRFLLRCEIDAAFFHLYGVERDDVDYVMGTFAGVRRDDEQRHGEYRTKRVILEIYDEMARAIETGEPYQTRLDPPPADPQVAHSAAAGAATTGRAR